MRAAGLAALLLSLLPTAEALAQRPSFVVCDENAAEKKIRCALASPTAIEFIETPLQDVVDFIKEFHEIEIQIDTRALGDVGIGSDTPITRNVMGITLRSALRLMLRELDLTYVIQDEVLLITTPEEAYTRPVIRVYNVAQFLDFGQPADDLAERLGKVLGHRWHRWNDAAAGGEPARDKSQSPGRPFSRIVAYRQTLIVTETETGHEQMHRLLVQLWAGLTGRLDTPQEPAACQSSRCCPAGKHGGPAPPQRKPLSKPAVKQTSVKRDAASDAGDRGGAEPTDDPFGGSGNSKDESDDDPFGGGDSDPFEP